MPKKILLTLVVMMFCAGAFAQTVITGKVVDASGPVVGAAVVEAGTSNGTSTDLDGSFRLTVTGNPTIEISSIGYATQSFAARSVPSVVTLVEDNEFIEETVVVGYGVQKKSNVTGAIASVKSETLQNRSNENVVSSLQGKVAGVQIVSSSGAPGSESSFRIRGYSSTNSSPDPLILVDGLKVRSIDYLDPESVESIEVLKDAASAAIYGSQAGNGVVLVTTKSGSEANTRLFYNNMFSFRNPMENIKMLNAEQFKNYWMETGSISADQFQNADTNWQDVMFETGFQQRHTVGLQGGNNRFSYYVDATYLNNNGIIVGDKDKNERVTGQVNVSYQVKPWVKVGTNVSIERGKMTTVSENASIATGSILGGAYYYDPTTPVVYMNDSELPSDPNFDYRAAEAAGLNPMKDVDGHYFGQSFLLTSNLYNPMSMLSIRNSTNWRTNVNGTAYADLTPIKGLTFTSRFGFRLSSNYSKGFTPRFWVHAFQQSTNVSISGSGNNQQYYQWENFANYLKTIGKHDISAMAGMEFASTHYESINAAANGLVNEDERFWYLNFYDPTALSRTMGGSDYSRSNLSFFGRLA
ncbi:MAG: SusC/RagA family TonB-linked outer membrane protein, partial [Bacteroidales bacterium]|nr:SusC/RagA family TonB-linked outer membrane protein [Bacteroidales bacterium]